MYPPTILSLGIGMLLRASRLMLEMLLVELVSADSDCCKHANKKTKMLGHVLLPDVEIIFLVAICVSHFF